MSEPSYDYIIYIGYRNEKAQIYMNKPVYLGLSILELSVMLMYEFCYDYLKAKDGVICIILRKIVLYAYRQLHCIHKSR